MQLNMEIDLTKMEEENLTFKKMMDTIEYTLLKFALKKSGGNKTLAAKILRMNRTTFVESFKRLGGQIQ